MKQLTGSEKQIAWATTIRENILGALDKMQSQMDRKLAVTDNDKKLFDTVITEIAYMHTITSSVWWIENRTITVTSFIRAMRVKAGVENPAPKRNTSYDPRFI